MKLTEKSEGDGKPSPLAYSFKKFIHTFHNICPVFFGQSIVQRKSYQTLAFSGGVHVFTVEASEHLSGWCQVKGYVMKDCHDSFFTQPGDETASCLQIFELQVEHVGVVFGVVWYKWQFHSTTLGKRSELLIVVIPGVHAIALDGFAGL